MVVHTVPSYVKFTKEEVERAKRIYNYINKDNPIIDEDDPRNSLFNRFQLGDVTNLNPFSKPHTICGDLLSNPKYSHIK